MQHQNINIINKKLWAVILLTGFILIQPMTVVFAETKCYAQDKNGKWLDRNPIPVIIVGEEKSCPIPSDNGNTIWTKIDDASQVKIEVPFSVSKIPETYKKTYFVTTQTDGKCPTGVEKDVFGLTWPKESTHIQPIDMPLGEGKYMKACVAAKSEKDALIGDIKEGTAPELPKISGTVKPYELSVPIPCDPNIAGGACPTTATPAGYIARLYQFGLMIAGLVAFGSIIFGSVKYILSAGSITNQQDAKDQITQAILGLALLLGAYIVLYTINPDLVNLRNPNAEIINIENLPGGNQGTDQSTGQEQSPVPGEVINPEHASACSTSMQVSVIVNGENKSKIVCLTCSTGRYGSDCSVCDIDKGYSMDDGGRCVIK
ncbi:MAG: hypothetical protein Q7S73_01425 [bacterium]|nr:hypothetical protein [bacterium]